MSETATVEAPSAPKAPPSVKQGINSMAEKFNKFMAKGAPEAPASEPAKPIIVEKPAPVAVEVKSTEPKPLVPELKERTPEPVSPAPTTEEPAKITSKNFKQLEAWVGEYKGKWESTQKELAEIQRKYEEASSRNTPEWEATQKELAELREHRDRFNLQHSPEFKRAFDGRIESTILEAKESVAGASKEQIEKILRTPPGEFRNEQLKKFANELEDDFEKGVVRDAYSRLRTIERDREAELAKVNDNVQALKIKHEHDLQTHKMQAMEHRQMLLRTTLEKATKSLPEFIENDDVAHNAEVLENRAMMQEMIMNELPPEQFGRMASWAIHGYRSLSREKVLHEKIATLEAELGKVNKVTPSLEGSGSKPGTARTKLNSFSTPKDIVAAATARWEQAMASGIPPRNND